MYNRIQLVLTFKECHFQQVDSDFIDWTPCINIKHAN